MSAETKTRYHLVKAEIDCDDNYNTTNKPVPRRWPCGLPAILFHAALLAISTSLFALSFTRPRCQCSPGDETLNSPVFNRMNVTSQEKHFNNTFWPDAIPSIFQQLPSPEVDRAWERYGDTKAIATRRDEIDRFGLDARTLWRWPEDVAGPNAYMGSLGVLDMFHQIYCLDHLKRGNFPEYYGDLKTKYENATFSFEQHNLHCQNLLLNVITCHADLEFVTFNKVEGIKGLFADFSVNRKCRNFEDILAWKEENEIGLTDESMETPDGIIELDAVGRAKPWPTR